MTGKPFAQSELDYIRAAMADGKKWCEIATGLPGRSRQTIRNRVIRDQAIACNEGVAAFRARATADRRARAYDRAERMIREHWTTKTPTQIGGPLYLSADEVLEMGRQMGLDMDAQYAAPALVSARAAARSAAAEAARHRMAAPWDRETVAWAAQHHATDPEARLIHGMATERGICSSNPRSAQRAGAGRALGVCDDPR